MKKILTFRKPDRMFVFLVGLQFLIGTAVFGQKIYYVTSVGGAITKDGSSWTNAFDQTQLQDAIEAASTYSLSNGNQEVQVWVAAGIYKPTTTSSRTISFTMRNHVAIYGGFAGDEVELADRPPIGLSTPSSTTLSGDIGGAGNADNSYHVINNLSTTLTTSAVLDGFIITAGNANNGSEELDMVGGGMANQSSSPTVRNCLFIANVASNLGGAIHNQINSAGTCSPVITNCGFTSNSASSGGAIHNIANFGGACSPVITNCSFSQNTAAFGGGLHNNVIGGGSCSPVVTSCSFTSNSATNSGVIANEGGSPVVANCSFTNNAATKGGVSLNYSLQFFTNCSFSGNTAIDGGGVSYQTGGATTFKNCIFWNNGGSLTFNNLGTAEIIANFCLFDAGAADYTGTNNQTTSVLPFVSATDLQLLACSPAINAGDPASTTASSGTTDLAGNPRFYNGGIIDIGAFESQSEAPTPPVVSLAGESSLTIIQNTPSINLTITGCGGGSLAWAGTDGSSGTGSPISVPTSATGTLIYSATCTAGSCVSAPGTATVTIVPASVTGSFEGYVYGADCGSFRGWAWDRNKLNTAVSIDILDGATVIATLPAGDFRPDLLDAGKGNGKHGFRYTIPDGLKDNLPHSLSAQVTSSGFVLKNSPKALICQNSTVPPDNQPPLPPTPTTLITPLAAQVDVPFSATLAAFTDPEGGTLTYGLSDLPGGLSINSLTRIISGTPTESGSFVLTYTATDEPGATNSVSFVLTVSPAGTVTGNFEGFLDKVECGTIRGWVWDRNQPNSPVTVEFYTGSTVWGSAVADIYRIDLKNAGKGNGSHAYRFEVPASLIGTGPHVIYGRVQGSSYVLKESGKSLNCPSGSRISAADVSGFEITVLGNPLNRDVVEVEVRGAGGKSLRLELTDIQGQLINEYLIEKAVVSQRHQFDVSRQSSGVLLLHVTTPGQRKTVKIVKAN
jgi:hypothetical protein